MITGPPRCGKTTLILRIIQDSFLSDKVGGFITEEVREKGERIGFKIISLPDNKEGLLARKDFSSPYRVGKYGVHLEDLENTGCAAIEDAIRSEKAVIVDEIGKMELFSEKFKNSLVKALDSPLKVLASVMERKNEFANRIKRRSDVTVARLDRSNFNVVVREVQSWFKTPDLTEKERKEP